MKKTLIIALMLCSPYIYGQKPNAVYLITTSISGENQTGVMRRTSTRVDSLDNSPPIHFFMEKQNRFAFVHMSHYDYNLTQLAKIRGVTSRDRMEKINKPLSFLNSIQPVDIDNLNLTSTTDQQIWDWANSILDLNSPIYIIDRNDFTSTSMTLIEVDLMSNAPHGFIIHYE